MIHFVWMSSRGRAHFSRALVFFVMMVIVYFICWFWPCLLSYNVYAKNQIVGVLIGHPFSL